MEKLVKSLSQKYPAYCFKEGEKFCWSPQSNEIIFCNPVSSHIKDHWSLLHETSHALLGHTSYKTDLELLRLEVAAWQKAKELALDFKIDIDEDHIQDCLDTYREWLYRRSICPRCGTKCLQEASSDYRCFNCHMKWKVSGSRFCRSYRYTK